MLYYASKPKGDNGYKFSVTGGIMSFKTDENLYTISRSEFAKQIGKSREAVKIAMRRGKYSDQYIYKNGKYFFKAQEGVRPNQEKSPPELIKMYPLKRERNRGKHDIAVKKGRYPNRAFEEHNTMKKMVALRGKLTPKQIAMIPKLEREAVEEDRRQSYERAKEKKVIFTESLHGLQNESRRGYPFTVMPGYYDNQRAYSIRNKGNEWKEEWDNPGPKYYW